MTLYEIDQALLDLMEQTDPETGEWTGDPEEWERLNLAKEAKVEATACYLKGIRGDMAALEQEIKTLTQRLKALRRKDAWIMERLRQSLDGQNFETTRCQLRFKMNPESVRLTDEGEVMAWAREYAPDCLRYKPATISLEDIKAELRKGTEIPGAELVRETRLEVK